MVSISNEGQVRYAYTILESILMLIKKLPDANSKYNRQVSIILGRSESIYTQLLICKKKSKNLKN